MHICFILQYTYYISYLDIFRANNMLIFRRFKLYSTASRMVKVKVKQSRYRPGVTQTVPGSWVSQISWQRHRMVVRLSALRTGRLYSQEIHLVLISVRGWVDPKAIVRPEGLSLKIPVIPSGIEPATCRFVAWCFNHYATARPSASGMSLWKLNEWSLN
jgi:hypothetical protein